VKTNFLENYVVEKSIGSGAFAKVYRARSRENGRYYAIKAFSKEHLNKVKNVKIK
jgi:serine/threonine protein kinase